MSVTIDTISHVIAGYFAIDPGWFKRAESTAKERRAKHIAVYLIRKLTGFSLRKIVDGSSYSDHTSVAYAEKKIAIRMREDTKCNEQVNEIEQRCLQACGVLSNSILLLSSEKNGLEKAYLDEDQVLRVRAFVEEMGLQWAA